MADRERERQLLARCRAGDEGAWCQVYREHAPSIRRYLEGVLGARSDVEDQVQRVFLTFLRTLDRYEHRGTLRTWLFGIALQVSRNAHRAAGRHRRRLAALAAAMRSLVERGHDSPLARTEARRDLETIALELAAMDLKYREVWVLREVVGMSPEEAAETLGARTGTVRSRHCRARSMLMAALAARPDAPRWQAEELASAEWAKEERS